MTEAQPTPQVVRSYLAQLEAALVGVPDSVSRDIRAGVAEELTGLDAAAAAARIEELGDPAFIAAEARAEAGAPPVIVAPPVAAPAGDSRAYTIIAALLVALGGILVPVLGWVVGIAMVWMSRTWSLGEKWIATLTGPVSVVLGAGIAATVSLAEYQVGFPESEDLPNPVVPAFFDAALSSFLLLVLVNVVVGMWLLWRARGRL
ncbi:hypothetical protein [Diaminobutyricimonas sp. TR449]|uniref:HAAS signaling domain-containing protein n=1 Tax=Diaminobutyricimonas sp. TR449 TaxID=2708076 RepID=UPI00141D753D|nr:hypothetical protein [Diaminobutyricimonas sp. TR449]